MKNRILNISIWIAAAVLLFAVLVSADEGRWFVNDGESTLPGSFDGVYAIGSDGTSLLFGDEVYALSARGLQKLGSAMAAGGGGLRYDDETIAIRDTTVHIGLYYTYSADRDSSVERCTLENVVGSGFSIGTNNDEGEYEEIVSTESRRITVRKSDGSAVAVFAEGSEEALCVLESTDRLHKLIVLPLTEEGEEALTGCSGRNYYGAFDFAVIGSGKLTVANIVDIERYVMGVCACEMIESWPLEALKAQAVAARTFVQKYVRNSVYYYRCGFDVTADTYCQAYRGNSGIGRNIETAVRETENQYLTYQGSFVEAAYSAADGGATEDAQNVFGNSIPYLRGVNDPYEAAAAWENPYSAWSVTMTPKQLAELVGLNSVRSVGVEKSDTGNVIKLELTDADGRKVTLIRDQCRTKLGSRIRNIRYDVEKNAAGNYVFTGSGFGHNVGMSQWGAYAMAKYYEKDYRFILGFYYSNVGISYGATV